MFTVGTHNRTKQSINIHFNQRYLAFALHELSLRTNYLFTWTRPVFLQNVVLTWWYEYKF